MRIGHPHLHLRRTGSTSSVARELALAGAAHGTLVSAGEQTAGRGRSGRGWQAPAGAAVLASLVLRTPDERSRQLLALAAAVAVAHAVRDELDDPDRVQVKWPNDVWIDRRKVAGILVEARAGEGWVILGVGLNVSTSTDELGSELREHATSLALASAAAPSIEVARARILSHLDHWLAEAPERVLAAWRALDGLRGEQVAWEGGEGLATGIDDTGALLVELDRDETIALNAGEVHLRRRS